MADELADLEQRARSGEWLGVVAVATLLEVNRSTVDDWAQTGRLSWKRHGIRNRVYNPVEVLAILDESRRIHGAESGSGQDSAGSQ